MGLIRLRWNITTNVIFNKRSLILRVFLPFYFHYGSIFNSMTSYCCTFTIIWFRRYNHVYTGSWWIWIKLLTVPFIEIDSPFFSFNATGVIITCNRSYLNLCLFLFSEAIFHKVIYGINLFSFLFLPCERFTYFIATVCCSCSGNGLSWLIATG